MNKNIISFPKTNVVTFTIRPKTGSSLSHLSFGLMLKLHIYNDMSLVSLLGNGNEHSNHEAIINWVLLHYTREDIHSMDKPLESLTKSLHNFLLDSMEDSSC